MFSSKKILNLRGAPLDLSVPRIMGVLNVTPDSFFDGGRYTEEKTVLKQAETLLREGADLIDIGGASSRPGAAPIPVGEELQRVIPAIRGVRKAFPQALLSVDTFRAEVARQALDEGVVMVNDVSGGALDKAMFPLIARYRASYVLTHMRGDPRTMQGMTDYEDLCTELINYFNKRIAKLHQQGITDIVIDPGLGFAKTVSQNFELIKRLELLETLDKPLLVGASRKSMIWKTLGITPQEALNGSTVLHTVALLRGADLLRVHDVKEAAEAIKLISFVV